MSMETMTAAATSAATTTMNFDVVGEDHDNVVIPPPEEFICPLTKGIMTDPVMSRYGTHFERDAILDWLQVKGNTFCPVTRKPLRVSNLISDKTLQWKIKFWLKKKKRHTSNGNGTTKMEYRKKKAAGAATTAGAVAKEQDEDDERCYDGYLSNDDDDIDGWLKSLSIVDGGGAGFSIALPPSRFICPLTKKIMEDPVMTKDGNNFERAAIRQWLDDMGNICPIEHQQQQQKKKKKKKKDDDGKKAQATRKILHLSDLVSNNKLRWEIEQWQLQYGEGPSEMTPVEMDSKLAKGKMVSQDYHLADIIRALTEGLEEDSRKEKATAKGEEKEEESAENRPQQEHGTNTDDDEKQHHQAASSSDNIGTLSRDPSIVLDMLDEVVDTLDDL